MKSSFAVDYHPKTPESEIEERFPPRYRLPAWAEGQDFETMTARHGRPIQLLCSPSSERCLRYASRSLTDTL